MGSPLPGTVRKISVAHLILVQGNGLHDINESLPTWTIPEDAEWAHFPLEIWYLKTEEVCLQDPLQSHNDCPPLLFGSARLNATRFSSGKKKMGKGSPTRFNVKHLLQIPQNQWAEGWSVQKATESSPVGSLPLATVRAGSLKRDGASTPLCTCEALRTPDVLTLRWTQVCLLSTFSRA